MKLEEQLRRTLRLKGHAQSTEKAYVTRYRQFINFVKTKKQRYVHPAELDHKEVENFLSYLANDKKVSPATQRSALSALKFLYEDVLNIELSGLTFARAPKRAKLPVVLSFGETRKLLDLFTGTSRLQSELMYGCGLRISDCLKLRIKDIDFESKTIQINHSKGSKSRLLMLPNSVVPRLQEQLEVARTMFQSMREYGGQVSMPEALGFKAPSWAESWDWFWVFPANQDSKHPRSKALRRFHIGREKYCREFKRAKQSCQISKAIVPHTWRHSRTNQ